MILQATILTFSIKNYGGDLFTNEVIIVSGALIALSVSWFLVEKLKLKIIVVIGFCFGLITTAGFLYPHIKQMNFLPIPGNDLSMIILFLAKLGIASV